MSAATFLRPGSIAQAVDALRDERAVPLAGGVSVAALANLGLFTVERLVSLAGIPELRGVRIGDGVVRIGATSTHRELAADPVLAGELPVLAMMFGHIGNVRVRAWGTVGGALAEPSPDPPVLLAALGADVVTAGQGGSRRLPLAESSDGPVPGRLEPGELITAVEVPVLAADERSAYLKFLPRSAADSATVTAGVRLRLDGAHVTAARLYCGSVGPVPIACHGTADLLLGRSIEDPVWLDGIAESVARAVPAVSDRRGSADYKRRMAGVIACRALRSAVELDSPHQEGRRIRKDRARNDR
jgi:aerobic carbon-monoxide dehydrogenase medium subunit